ncbi:hypothetical protein BpHYR1_016576 [Brachionus plicatilis]|uniref:Uncharacterized protein n=1 Tax=Brachionus plicatilis TaxID=10195 RepID=A0A3M7QMN1_BRAPC|nr:hypothetical protein BpHYR1_016576 [Brachionus plicatilis]
MSNEILKKPFFVNTTQNTQKYLKNGFEKFSTKKQNKFKINFVNAKWCNIQSCINYFLTGKEAMAFPFSYNDDFSLKFKLSKKKKTNGKTIKEKNKHNKLKTELFLINMFFWLIYKKQFQKFVAWKKNFIRPEFARSLVELKKNLDQI